MPVKDINVQFAYGMGDNLIPLSPLPIVARRDPATNDIAQLGTLWINSLTSTAWVLTGVTAGAANWVSSPVAGATVVASLQVTGAGGIDVDIGDVDINLGNLILGAGNATIAGDLTVAGTTTINGDFDLTSAALIDLTSTLNADPSIYLHANGGVLESILLHSDQGTDVDSVQLLSDVGGITLTATGLATADAINLEASAGGIDMDAALQINIASSQNAVNAIVLSASAGGIDILATGAATEDIDIINTGGSVNITATEDAAQAIYIRANGGVSETVQIHADQGTGVASLNLLSDVGGITLSAGLATADAINIITSNAAGGIDVDAGTAGFIVDSTGAFSLDGAAASNASVSGAGIDLSLVSAAGRVVVNGEEAAADAVTLLSAAGGLDANVALQMNLDSSQAAAADSIRIVASAADGGIDIDAGTGGITIDSTGAVSVQGAAASDFSVSGAGIDLTLASAAGRVVADGGEAAADAVRLVASNAAGGIDADAGTGGIAFDSTGAVSLQGAAASDFSVSGAGIDLSLVSAAGRVIMNGEEAAADALTLLSAAGGLDVNVALQMNLDSSQAAADAIRILASNAAGGIDVDSGTAGMAVDSTGALSLQAAAASDFSVSGAGIDLSLVSAAGRVIVNGEEAAANAITLLSAAGGIDADAALQINIASSQNAANAIVINASAGGIDITNTGTAGEDIDIASSGASVNISASEAIADAIVLNASNAAGGIDLLTGGGEITISSAGNVTMVPATASVAGTSLTINARVGVATFTGLTTAAAATETLTITNSALGAGDGIFCTVSNRGTNDAQMTLTRVNTQTAGSLVVQCDNNGAAALNGDIIVTFWVIN